ncbi:MAG: mechanosensitive ion channel family protein [Firmicutes bacterium]|nr:mechanosensitive ion channel family protein [Bacillota bacterium]
MRHYALAAAILPDVADPANPLAKILYAAAALLIGAALSVLLARLTKRFFTLLGKGKKPDVRRLNTIASAASAVVRFLILFFAVIQALSFLGFQSVITSLFATVGLGTIVLTISMQSLLRDISVGLFMLIENEFSVGDYVTIGTLSGRVEKFNLRTTTLRADTGELHFLPNGNISAATNYSKGKFQISADISFSAACDPFRTIELLQAGVEKAFPGGHAAVHHTMTFNSDSYTVRALCDCPIGRKVETERELVACVIKTMADEKIPLPNGMVPVVGEEPMK